MRDAPPTYVRHSCSIPTTGSPTLSPLTFAATGREGTARQHAAEGHISRCHSALGIGSVSTEMSSARAVFTPLKRNWRASPIVSSRSGLAMIRIRVGPLSRPETIARKKAPVSRMAL